MIDTTAGGTRDVPDGAYRVEISVLKALGSAQPVAHGDLVVSTDCDCSTNTLSWIGQYAKSATWLRNSVCRARAACDL